MLSKRAPGFFSLKLVCIDVFIEIKLEAKKTFIQFFLMHHFFSLVLGCFPILLQEIQTKSFFGGVWLLVVTLVGFVLLLR